MCFSPVSTFLAAVALQSTTKPEEDDVGTREHRVTTAAENSSGKTATQVGGKAVVESNGVTKMIVPLPREMPESGRCKLIEAAEESQVQNTTIKRISRQVP